MSIPFSFSSSEIPKSPVGKTSLQDAGPASFATGQVATKDNPSATFDRVLDNVHEDPNDSGAKESKDAPTHAPAASSLSSDQLALMMSMIMPNPAPVPLPVAQPLAPATADHDSSLELLGAEGRSIPELLVRGNDLLEYQVAPAPADNLGTPSHESNQGRSVLPPNLTTQPLSTGDSALPATGQLSPDEPPTRSVSSASMRGMPQPQGELPLPVRAASAQSALASSEAAAAGQPAEADRTRAGLGGFPLLRSSGMLGVRPLRLRDMSRDLTTPAQPESPPLPAQSGELIQGGPNGPSALAATPPASGANGSSLFPKTVALATGDDAPASDDQRSEIPTTASSPSASAGVETPASAVNAAAAQTASANLPRPRSGASERPEKNAGSSSSIRPSGGKSSSARGKNVALPADGEALDKTSPEVGTDAANWGKTMYQESHNFPSASAPSASSSFGGLLRSEHGTTAEDVKQVSPAHATDLVHEIREIADGLWAVERNSVEVKFNFGEQERLSVRVEYRNGTVQATFRTDSSDVRDAIAREWQAQGGLADQRPYRVADPVFTSATTPPTSGFSFGSDTSRQQRSPEQQPQPAPFERLTLGSSSRSAAPHTSSPLTASTSPREAAGRLHALV